MTTGGRYILAAATHQAFVATPMEGGIQGYCKVMEVVRRVVEQGRAYYQDMSAGAPTTRACRSS